MQHPDRLHYPVDAWAFRDRHYTITRQAVLGAFAWRCDTRDGLCALCEEKSDKCKCTETDWRNRIDMNRFSAYLENHGLLDWLREHVIGDFAEPARFEIDMQPRHSSSREIKLGTRVQIECSPCDLGWAHSQRFDNSVQRCVYCGLLKEIRGPDDPCKCSIYEWSLLDVDEFVKRVQGHGHAYWLYNQFAYEPRVRTNPARDARKKKMQ